MRTSNWYQIKTAKGFISWVNLDKVCAIRANKDALYIELIGIGEDGCLRLDFNSLAEYLEEGECIQEMIMPFIATT